MRVQSSIEFLSTYSFLFIIMAVAVAIILFIAATPASSVSSQCGGYSGLNCNFVQIYANQSAHYTLLTLVLSNSQGVPVNISGISAMIRGATATGTCTPSLLYPGQGATCAANFQGALPFTSTVQGYYSVNAMFCNSGISTISVGNCNYEMVSYGGAFTSVPVSTRAIVFSVVASQSPSNLQLVPFNAIRSLPVQPNNYSILQNGDWVSALPASTMYYAYASNTVMLKGTYFGYKPQPYPAALASLTMNGVGCAAPFNSLMSIASTTLYMSSPGATLPTKIEAGGAVELFYRYAQPNQPWANALLGNAWKTGLIQSGTFYSFSLPLTTNGLYNVEVWWSDTCGSGGQVLQVNSIPS